MASLVFQCLYREEFQSMWFNGKSTEAVCFSDFQFPAVSCERSVSKGRVWRKKQHIYPHDTSFFLSHCQAMRLVHLQTAKHRGALKKALKRHLVKIYTYSVLLNIICLTACFVEWCVAVGLLTWEKKREVNSQKLHMFLERFMVQW